MKEKGFAIVSKLYSVIIDLPFNFVKDLMLYIHVGIISGVSLAKIYIQRTVFQIKRKITEGYCIVSNNLLHSAIHFFKIRRPLALYYTL